MPTPRDEALLFRDNPGFQGALARLILVFDPGEVKDWIEREIARGTQDIDVAKAMGEVLAAATFTAVSNAPAHIDKMAFMNADLGILGQMRDRLEMRLRAPEQKANGGIIIPGGSG